ncbi:MAG TPA: PfkB family carbohydrate kinase, partial [Frankiaceae bacterium]|nr:PfkB family carbohydrate kinase [Frankiaceae bacterium]
MTSPLRTGQAHVAALLAALPRLDTDRLDGWGRHLAALLPAGGRLLVAGNGGSAAEAQHLTSELVGRLRDDRPPLSAIALHAETSSLTAIGNDYGYEEAFARQVRAHGRPGDVLLAISTSGRSPNVLRAAEQARALGLVTWALTGPPPSPLAALADEVVAVGSDAVATVQEAHLVAVHLICAAVDVALGVAPAATATPPPPPRFTALGGSLQGCETPQRGRRRVPLVVVGDALLDRDLVGRVERLSPDAPVPVVDGLVERARPGGAGLAALLAARDGRKVTLVTALAGDDAGHELAALLTAAGVRVVDLGLDGATPQKVRVRCDGRSLLRLDRGDRAPGAVGPLPPAGRDALARARAVLVADYGRGVAAAPSVRAALEALPRRVPVVWDPHPRGAEPIRGARLVTPNAAEARHFAPGDGGTDRLTGQTARARRLVERWGATAVAVTLGPRGALLVGDADTPPLVAPAPPVPPSDPCGAGDRFASAAAGLLADGALPSEAVTGAVAAASAFVAAGGAAAVAADGERGPAPCVDGDGDPLAVVARVRAAGGTVVATGGCFDLLHAGHVAVLRQARALGDCL